MDPAAENQYLVSVPLNEDAAALFVQLQGSLVRGVFDVAFSLLEVVAEERDAGRDAFLLRLEEIPNRPDVRRLLDVDPLIVPLIPVPTESIVRVHDFWVPASEYHRCCALRSAFACADLSQLGLMALYTLARIVRAVRSGKAFCTARVLPPPDGQPITPLCVQDVSSFAVALRDVALSSDASLAPIDLTIPPRTYAMLRELETHFGVVGLSETMTCVLLSVGDLVDVWKRDDVSELFPRMWLFGIDAREAAIAEARDPKAEATTDVMLRLELSLADRETLALIASFLEMPQSDALFVRLIQCAYYRMLQLTKALHDDFPPPIP